MLQFSERFFEAANLSANIIFLIQRRLLRILGQQISDAVGTHAFLACIVDGGSGSFELPRNIKCAADSCHRDDKIKHQQPGDFFADFELGQVLAFA